MEKESENPLVVDENVLAQSLADFGYPGFSHLRFKNLTYSVLKEPESVLLSALSFDNLDARIVEALPWLVLTYSELDWHCLIRDAEARDLQNRLGFIVTIAVKVAEMNGLIKKASDLKQVELNLEQVKLSREDTLCRNSMTKAEMKWLKEMRSGEAVRWNLLTNLSAEHLNYAKN